MKIEMNKKYISNGKNIRIICIDRPNTTYPILGMFDDGSILSFDENGVYVHEEVNNNLIEVWEPQAYEWCLFTDATFYGAMLLQYLSTTITGRFHAKGAGISFDGCTKFTGELPEHLKGK
jgi:hypothetical protein